MSLNRNKQTDHFELRDQLSDRSLLQRTLAEHYRSNSVLKQDLPDDKSYYSLASKLYKQENYLLAFAFLQEGIKKFPYSFLLHQYKYIALNDLQQYHLAAEQIDKILTFMDKRINHENGELEQIENFMMVKNTWTENIFQKVKSILDSNPNKISNVLGLNQDKAYKSSEYFKKIKAYYLCKFVSIFVSKYQMSYWGGKLSSSAPSFFNTNPTQKLEPLAYKTAVQESNYLRFLATGMSGDAEGSWDNVWKSIQNKIASSENELEKMPESHSKTKLILFYNLIKNNDTLSLENFSRGDFAVTEGTELQPSESFRMN